MIYQHPNLEKVRAVVNEIPEPAILGHNPRHMAVM
jgi:hypothetical protein